MQLPAYRVQALPATCRETDYWLQQSSGDLPATWRRVTDRGPPFDDIVDRASGTALGVKGFEVKIQPSVQDHLAYVIETSAVAPVRLRRAWVRA